MKRLTVITGLIFLVLFQAQCQNSVLDLFRSKLKTADLLYKRKDFVHAIDAYQAAYSVYKDSTYITLQIARSLYNLNQKSESASWYFRVRDTTSFTSEDKLNIAEILHSSNRKEEAVLWYGQYRKEKPQDLRIEKKMEALKQFRSFYTDTLSYKIKNLSINTSDADFFPYLKGNKLLFLSDRSTSSLIQHLNAYDESSFLEIYEVDTNSTQVRKFNKEINTAYHEGPFCFLNNGNKIIFTRSGRKNKKLMLFIADITNNHIEHITSLPFNNPDYSVSHPSFSLRDSSLYFVSDMPGGYGGTDLYRSKLSNGHFAAPENLGPLINTEGNEMFPFMQGNKLYFSSDGHGGLGGLDIFYTINNNGQWNQITNIGAPVNSSADDFSIHFIAADRGYFSSNRNGGIGKDDIYQFEEVRHNFSLKITEKFNHKIINNAILTVQESDISIISDSLIASQYDMHLKPGKKYKLLVCKEGYKCRDTVFTTPNIPDDTIKFEIPLERKSRIYIKGIVAATKGTLEGATVSMSNKSIANEKIITTTSNEEGEFILQVDPEYSYSIVVESNGLVGTATFSAQTNKKKRASSSVIVMHIQCVPSITKEIPVLVKDSLSGRPLAGSHLQVENNFSNEKTIVNTDNNGQAIIKINTAFEYTVTPFCDTVTGAPLLINNSTEKAVLTVQ